MEPFCERTGDPFDFRNRVLRERDGRRYRRGVAGMASCRLDVLKYRANDGRLAVGDAVDVEFYRVREELVYKDRLAFGYAPN